MITQEQTEERYDRQIRLWGIQGQRRLAKASICLLGCGGAGVEALKNLVLPGVGQIVIVDNVVVQLHHLGINFFLERTSVGKSLASQTVNFLLELNPYVKGKAVEASPVESINQTFLSEHTLIISNQLSEESNILLSKVCEKINKPLIILNTYGFYAYIRNQMVCHEIHEVKENKKFDLRIRQPFEGLLSHCNEFDIEELIKDQGDPEKLKILVHIPYVVLLIKAFTLSVNKTSKQTKQILTKWRHQINMDVVENFLEAEKNAMVISQSKENLFQNLKIILDHDKCVNATEESGVFWKFSKTLKRYIEIHNNYPQSHDLPDMYSTTDGYINFKNVYKHENARTKTIFKDLFAKEFPNSTYENVEIDTFVENILSLSIIEMRPYYQEIEDPQFTFEGDWPQIYNALRAADHFKMKHKRVPNPQDFEEVKKELSTILSKIPNQDIMASSDKIIKEVCRAQQSEMISISSIAGSIAAQEAIKLITHLFTPMNTGYLFNGTRSEGFMTEL